MILKSEMMTLAVRGEASHFVLPKDEEDLLYLIRTVGSRQGEQALRAVLKFSNEDAWKNPDFPILFEQALDSGRPQYVAALLPIIDFGYEESFYEHRNELLEMAYDDLNPLHRMRKRELAAAAGQGYISQHREEEPPLSPQRHREWEQELSYDSREGRQRFASILFGSLMAEESTMDEEQILQKQHFLLDRFESAGNSKEAREAIYELVRQLDSEREDTDIQTGVLEQGMPILPDQGLDNEDEEASAFQRNNRLTALKFTSILWKKLGVL